MPDTTIVTRYQSLTRALRRWYHVLDTTTSATRYDHASAHISVLGDVLDDLECEYPVLRSL